jgi:hypothetical protein
LCLSAAIAVCTTQAYADEPGKRTIETPAGNVVISPQPGRSETEVLRHALAVQNDRRRAKRVSALEAEVAALRKEVAALREIARDAGVKASPDVPILLEPRAGSIMPNGTDRSDSTVTWDFRWTPVEGADEYQLVVVKRMKDRPSIDTIVRDTEYRHVQAGTWSFGNWYLWRVRAIRDGKPLPWSELRTFDVEPMRFVEELSAN